MPGNIDEISVFFPAYNEEKNIKNTVLSAKSVLEKNFKKWEIIIVNDGSKDKTKEISDELARSDKRIIVKNHEPNKGYGASLRTGFYSSRYSWITFTDSDGQFDFSEIKNFISTQKETNADLVIGFYKDRKVSLSKKITSKMWEYLVFFLFGLKVRDIDCGFKLVSKKVIEGISRLESERGAFISSEFLIKAKKKGYKIVEIPVTHKPRTMGVGTGRKLDVIIQSFKDLFKLWRKLN
jgi:glycosyltransferase involved in cell wall biosynthesis